MKQLQRSEKAHELYQSLLKVLELKRFAGVALGEKLFKLKANNEYKNATGIESWDDFLKSPEISIDSRESNRAMQTYYQFCVRRQFTLSDLAGVPVKSLHRLLPLAKGDRLADGDLQTLVADAASLSQSAFKERLYDVVSGESGIRTFDFLLMRKCRETGNLQKVHGFSSEKIQEVFNQAGIDLGQEILPEII